MFMQEGGGAEACLLHFGRDDGPMAVVAQFCMLTIDSGVKAVSCEMVL